MSEAKPAEAPAVAENQAPANPKPASPVMDVRPPQAAHTETTTADVHEEPKPAADGAHEAEKTPETKTPKPAKAPKPPKPPRTPGVGMAITATVVIVLGLAVLAVYAYLQSNGL